MNLEKYRKTLKNRMRFCGIFIALTALPGFALRYLFELVPLQPFATGFAVGVMAGCIIAALSCICHMRKALKDEKKLKELYIKENDEREKLIGLKTASGVIVFVAASLLAASVAAVFFSMTVFYTLLAVVIFMGIVTLGFRSYYNKKL